MEAHAAEASKAVESAKRKLQHALKQQEPDYAGLEPLLEKLRVRSGNLALLTLTTEQPAEHIEQRLWGYHTEVNGKLKAYLKSFREGSAKKKHVERRKAEKLYVDFVKASQRFYRGYIERLAANFTSIPKVLDVARRFNKENLTVQEPKVAGDDQRKILEASCKRCIIYLGDLSRWRETELHLKERNWGPAKGYYNLALSFDPAEGACYNQLAVIALHVDDHVGAVYNLHRAFAVTPPFPMATENLKVEFEKVLRLNIEESYGLMDKSGDDIVNALGKRFLAFHAHCYMKPYDFVAFQQKASDILAMIALCFQDTKTGIFDHFLQRACLTNITAEYVAKKGMDGNVLARELSVGRLAKEIERNCQSFFLLQRFNLMTFQALLKALARELGDDVPEGTDTADMSRLSVTVRRILPHLRQYSSWYLSNMRSLVETRYKSSRRLLEQVSKTHAQALNLLRANVDVFAPSQVPYLLEEDVRTLSFSPFSPMVFRWRYTDMQNTLKPQRENNGQGKELSVELAEMHVRATDLIVDALRLVKHQDDLDIATIPLPITLENGQFVGVEIPEAALPVRPPSPPAKKWRGRVHTHGVSLDGVVSVQEKTPSHPTSTAPEIPVADIEMRDTSVGKATEGNHDAQPIEAALDKQPQTEEMPAILNSSSLGGGTPAAPGVNGMTAMDLVRKMQRSSVGSSTSQKSLEASKMFAQPSLPSVYNTAFAPTPNEKAQLSPRLETVQRQSPSFNTPETSSSGMFQDQIARQQREMQMRASPQQGFQPPASWDTSYGQTPTGLDSMFRAFEKQHGRTPSPYASPQTYINGRSPRSSGNSQQAPYGVIGQARPPSSGASMSGQG